MQTWEVNCVSVKDSEFPLRKTPRVRVAGCFQSSVAGLNVYFSMANRWQSFRKSLWWHAIAYFRNDSSKCLAVQFVVDNDLRDHQFIWNYVQHVNSAWNEFGDYIVSRQLFLLLLLTKWKHYRRQAFISYETNCASSTCGTSYKVSLINMPIINVMRQKHSIMYSSMYKVFHCRSKTKHSLVYYRYQT